MSFTFHKPTKHRGICLPYCCAGSQRISDSDISDYEVDDGIGVVPPGAWVKSMALLHCASYACFHCQFPDLFGILNWRFIGQRNQYYIIPW